LAERTIVSNKINRNSEPEKKETDAKKKILTGIILAVIALEVVLILFFMVRRSMNAARAKEAAESTAQTAAVTENSTEEAEMKDVTINWHGQERTIKATEDETDYTGRKIDFGDSAWWVEEGFVGQFTMTEELTSAEGVTESFSELMIYNNGAVVWITDDAVYSGELFENRYYGDAAHGYVKSDQDQMPRTFDLEFVSAEEDGTFRSYGSEEVPDGKYVRIFCSEQQEPDPLEEICVYLERIEE